MSVYLLIFVGHAVAHAEGKKSMEGIVVGSQRLVKFVLDRAAEMPNLERFSFVGYSLGGT